MPVHERASGTGDLRRVPDGTEARVLGALENGWLHVAFADGSRGYVTERYVGPDAAADRDAPLSHDAPLGERERACSAARQRASSGAATKGRIASYNVRWFPDGRPGKKAAPDGGTDLGFLACTIAATGAEVVLVQEFKRGARAAASLKTLLVDLGGLTHGDWEARFDDCPVETSQHVGVLFDRNRAKALGAARTLAALNPLDGACEGSLRPGLAQTFDLSTGAKVEVVSVHLKSGDDARSHALRATSLGRLRELAPPNGAVRIVGGDLNTMGCPDCVPAVSPSEERRQTAQMAKSAGFQLLDPPSGCSHYYRGHAGLLDGFLVSAGSGTTVETAGACAELACAPDRRDHAALDRVSDHCPLVLSLAVP